MDIGARIQAALDAGLDVEIRITPTKDRRPGRIIDGRPPLQGSASGKVPRRLSAN